MEREVPKSMGEIAKMAGWTTKQTRERLLLAHKQSGNTLLRQCGIRYYVTLSALRQVFPDFGKKTVDMTDIETISEIVVDLKRKYREQEQQLRELRKRVRELEARAGIKSVAA